MYLTSVVVLLASQGAAANENNNLKGTANFTSPYATQPCATNFGLASGSQEYLSHILWMNALPWSSTFSGTKGR